VSAELLDPVEPGSHAVQYYGHRDALVSSVTRYVGGGLVTGELAVVLAHPDHAAAFDAALDRSGVDVDAALGSGSYHAVDASAFLDDWDLASFAEAVGGLVRSLAAEGPLRVYGEMVSLLWDAGRAAEALELEEFWNALMRRTPFTLFCAYGGVERAAITCTHDVVVTDPKPGPRHPGRAVRRFEATTRAVPLARAFVTETLRGWGVLAEPAALVVTEIATNAVEHTGARLQVSVARLGDAVRIAVTDRSPAPLPDIVPAPEEAMGGRGLLLVETLSRGWGCDVHDSGKTVWALVDAPAL